MTTLPICERLRATNIGEVSRNGFRREETVLINPDGSEGAALIEELVEALERILTNPEASVGGHIRAEAIAALRKARGEA